jgi:hypothetical protein
MGIDSFKPHDFVELMQHIVQKHPKGVRGVARALWGEEKLDNKEKKLYRQIDHFDSTAKFNPIDFPRLINILNEGLTDTDKAIKGGDALLHYLNSQAGLVATRPSVGESKATSKDTLKDSFTKLMDFVSKLSSLLVREDQTSAITFVNIDLYKVQQQLATLKDAFQEKDNRPN